MGRDLYVQDDTFLRAQTRFTSSDGRLLLDFFLDDAILDMLNRELAIDVSVFRRIADDTEWWLIDEVASEDEQCALLLTLRQQMDRTWQSPVELAIAIEQVLGAIDRPHGFPLDVITAIQALPIVTTIDPPYYEEGDLARELRDLLDMVRHAIRRGASRVRLLVR